MNRPLKLLPIGGRKAGGTADLVPQARLSGPIPWVIAIMVMLTVIAAAGGLSLRKLASVAQNELSGGVTVQIVEARPEVRDRQVKEAVQVLSDLPGVAQVAAVPQAEVDALVEPWLGEEAGQAEIPVPALIDARLAGKVDRNRLEDLRSALRGKVPTARVDAQSTWLKPVFGALSSLQLLALALVLLLGLATAAAVLLATRSALGSNRETIEIVHLLGGTDSQIARIYQRSTAIAAAEGGVAGFAAAVIVVMLLGRQFAGLGAGMISGGSLGWLEWLVLALVPLAGIALATITARLTVLRSLARML
ncbi:cell division protein [Novosphingobium sp. MW5]|nr:cell division protein [Novosphingobium sp. MW5]